MIKCALAEVIWNRYALLAAYLFFIVLFGVAYIEKHIRLSEKEDDILRRKSEKSNVSVCEYIRRMAVNGKILRYDILSLHDNLISFRMVGTELNAIAKEINTYRTISDKNINALRTQLDFLESYTEKFRIPIPEIVGEGENP